MLYQYVCEPLTAEEADRLANACETRTEQFIVWTSRDTGLRVSELCDLTTKDVTPHVLRHTFAATALLRRLRLDQVLFGRSQYSLEADEKNVDDQVRVDVLRASAHVFLFKAADSFADRGFDFTFCSHGDLDCVASPDDSFEVGMNAVMTLVRVNDRVPFLFGSSASVGPCSRRADMISLCCGLTPSQQSRWRVRGDQKS